MQTGGMHFAIALMLMPLHLPAQEIDPTLRELLADPSMKTASAGVCVIPMEGEIPVMEWQADTGLIPASTMKAITTATALQVLGPEYVFETKVFLKGDDLVVKGGGDPTLGATSLTGDFEKWVVALKAAGLREILGDVVADPSRFESRTTPNDWAWGDVGNYYGAGPSGVNFHKNSFALTFRGEVIGESATLTKVWPKPPGVEFENHMKTGSFGSGDQGYVYGGPGALVLSMRGTIPKGGGFTINGALPNPPLMCATALKAFLEEKGVLVKGRARVGEVQVDGLKPVYVQQSPPLAKIVTATNHRSVNLYADSMFKALTPGGSTAGSVAKIRRHWKGQGVDLTGFVMHDGSGLSPRNTMTARQLAMILKKARKHKTGRFFEESLPVAGRSGTMAGFGKGTVLEGRLRAKSGSITRVKAYVGFFPGLSGRKYAFAVLTNNSVSSPKLALVHALAELVEKY